MGVSIVIKPLGLITMLNRAEVILIADCEHYVESRLKFDRLASVWQQIY
jgi:hypothetical protein